MGAIFLAATTTKWADFLQDRMNSRNSKHWHADVSICLHSSDEFSCKPFDIEPRLSFCRSNSTAILHSSWARTDPKCHCETKKLQHYTLFQITWLMRMMGDSKSLPQGGKPSALEGATGLLQTIT